MVSRASATIHTTEKTALKALIKRVYFFCIFLTAAASFAQSAPTPAADPQPGAPAAPAAADAPSTAPLSTELDPAALAAEAGARQLTVAQYHEQLRLVAASGADRLARFAKDAEATRRLISQIMVAMAEQQIAREAGCLDSPEFAAARRLGRLKLLADKALKAEPTPTPDASPVSEEELRETHAAIAKDQPGLVFYRVIFFRMLGESGTTQTIKRQRAEAALARARAGEDFFKLMQEVGEIPNPVRKPLRIGPGARGQDESLYDKLAKLAKGDISDIIETSTGLGIFQIDDKIDTIPAKPLETWLSTPELKAQLEKTARQRRNPKSEVNPLLERLRRELNAEALPIEEALALPPDSDRALIKAGSLTLTIRDFRDQARFLGQEVTSQTLSAQMPKMIETMLLAAHGQAQGLDSGLDHDPAWLALMRDLEHQCVVNQARAAWQPPSEAELRAEFDAKKELYKDAVRIDAVQLTLRPYGPSWGGKVAALVVQDEAKRIVAELNSQPGVSLDDYAAKYQSDRFKLTIRRWHGQPINIVNFDDGDYALEYAKQPNVVQGPKMNKARNAFVLYTVTAVQDPAEPDFEASRARILENLKSQQLQQTERALENQINKELKLYWPSAAIPRDFLGGAADAPAPDAARPANNS